MRPAGRCRGCHTLVATPSLPVDARSAQKFAVIVLAGDATKQQVPGEQDLFGQTSKRPLQPRRAWLLTPEDAAGQGHLCEVSWVAIIHIPCMQVSQAAAGAAAAVWKEVGIVTSCLHGPVPEASRRVYAFATQQEAVSRAPRRAS